MKPNKTEKAFLVLRTSERQFSASIKPKKKIPTLKSPDLIEKNNEEALVYELDNWENSKSKFQANELVEDAKSLLTRRKNHQLSAEETIFNRKKGPSKSCLSSPVVKNPLKDSLIGIKELSNYNKQFEEEVYKHYKEYLFKVCEVNRKRERLRADMIGLKEELKVMQKEIETHKKELKDIEKTKKGIKNSKTADYFLKRSSIKEDILKKEAKCLELEAELEEDIRVNGKNIEKLDKECSAGKKEMGILKEALFNHFKGLLKDGKDSRSEGLQWIVKAIWNLREKVSNSDFPNDTDEEIINCILKLAQKSAELEIIITQLQGRSPENSVFLSNNQEKLNEVHQRLAEVSRKIRIKKPELLVLNDRKSMIAWENCNPFSDHRRQLDTRKGAEVQKKIDLIKAEIESLREEGLRKIMKKNLFSPSESRKSDINLMISQLVGIENLEKYITYIIRMKREASDKLASIKTFTFSKKYSIG